MRFLWALNSRRYHQTRSCESWANSKTSFRFVRTNTSITCSLSPETINLLPSRVLHWSPLYHGGYAGAVHVGNPGEIDDDTAHGILKERQESCRALPGRLAYPPRPLSQERLLAGIFFDVYIHFSNIYLLISSSRLIALSVSMIVPPFSMNSSEPPGVSFMNFSPMTPLVLIDAMVSSVTLILFIDAKLDKGHIVFKADIL